MVEQEEQEQEQEQEQEDAVPLHRGQMRVRGIGI